MKVTLVRFRGQDVSVGYGKFCFPISDNKVQHEESQKAGSEYMGTIDQYNLAFELCSDCFSQYNFGSIEEN